MKTLISKYNKNMIISKVNSYNLVSLNPDSSCEKSTSEECKILEASN